jgi:hypothetical protein
VSDTIFLTLLSFNQEMAVPDQPHCGDLPADARSEPDLNGALIT